MKTKGLRSVDIVARLHRVISQIFQMPHVALIYSTSDIATVKHRCIKHLDGWAELLDGMDELGKTEIDDAIGTDFLSNFFVASVVSNQFKTRRHINTVDVGVSDSWCAGGKVDFLGAGIASHLNNFLGSSTSNNRIIDQKDILVMELQSHSVQLSSHVLATCLLTRHDESTTNISVLVETFTVGNIQSLRSLNGSCTGSIRHLDINRI